MLRSLVGSFLSCLRGSPWVGISVACAGAGFSLPAQPSLIWPGSKLARIETERLRMFVPYEHRQDLTALAARVDQVYGQMCRDAGFVPDDKLRVLLGNWVDSHNGYSFVVPFPLVQTELAPALPRSTIFNGFNNTERTLIHEFAHQISNDRNRGFRGVLESIFGRVLPNDLLSSLVWFLSTPAHQTMPRFWHEGLATWAETAYADPASAWAGRGRDPLFHMVWRLDAAAGAIPKVGDWRVTWHQWPFGNRVYVYGVAYCRYLSEVFGDRASVWDFITQQNRRWPFFFNGGARRIAGQRHVPTIEQARAALQREQEGQLAVLRTEPVTAARRLTPTDMVVGAPAWLPDGRLVFSAKPALGRARLHYLEPDGTLRGTWTKTRALAGVRVTDRDELVYHEFNWRGISRGEVAGDTTGWRLLQPDARWVTDAQQLVVGLEFQGGGKQRLVARHLEDGDVVRERVVPTEGMPWSPVLRGRSGTELLWVETDRSGSRFVLAPLDDLGARRVLLSRRGRLLHPCWTADGSALFFCSDHTGVANAYRLVLRGEGVEVNPVTNTIGGVVACVPSPDGRELAIVDHDARGPFLAKISAEPGTWPKTVPELELTWPAQASADRNEVYRLPPAAQGAAAATEVTPYRGLKELRPLFWSPSTFAVPEGGYGVFGLAADPLLTHVVQAGVGVGLVENEAVGYLSYDYLGWPIEIGLRGGRTERTFGDAVTDTTRQEFDFTETVNHGALRVGRGLFALEKTFLLHATVGIEDHDPVRGSTAEFAGRTLTSRPFFTGTERYVEATIGFSDTILFPTSYTFEDGFTALGVYRHSGLGGDLRRDLAVASLGYTWSFLPSLGHQIAVGGQAGWSEGDDFLQGNFSIGGGLSRGLPRGYFDKAEATGRFLAAGTVAYRFPVWRPFKGFSTTPFRARQLVVELFTDGAQVSTDRIGGNGRWFQSVGTELHMNMEFLDSMINPGIGVAYQLDGERDVEAYFSLEFRF